MTRVLFRIVTGILLLQPVQLYAELINVGYDDFNNPSLNIIDPADGSTTFTSLINNWQFLYEDTDGTGSLSINSTMNLLGAVEINTASVTTNTNGSLHVAGTIDFLDLGSQGDFLGDFIVTVDYDFSNNVTVFNFDPIVGSGLNYAGLLMTNGPEAGSLLDFQVTSSLLAIIDNPFPTYVPVPAAIWLFGSGLLALAGFSRKKR